MSARRQTQEGPSGLSNVVRLPTAAARKVKQRCNRWTWDARQELPQFPEERTTFARWPWLKKSIEKARLIQQVTPTPELMIVTAMFRCLPEMERLKVQAMVACMGLHTPEAALPAVEWLHYHGGMITNGERHDIRQALDMLASGGVQ